MRSRFRRRSIRRQDPGHEEQLAAAHAKPDTDVGGVQIHGTPNEQEFFALQRSVGNLAVAETLRSSGRPLAPGTRREMEERFHSDLSQVRVHTDAQAALSARSIHAAAYTVGRDVVFGPGRYAPGTGGGRRLLAHELAHVLQQTGGRGTRATAATAESEAKRAGIQVANAQPASILARVGAGVQRQPDDEDVPNARRKTDLPEEGLTERTQRSEKARHTSKIGERIELSAAERHHSLPKFLGGKKIQQLVGLPHELHYMYHRELYHLLEREFRRLGKITGRTSWKQFGKIFNGLSPTEQDDILQKVVDHADDFDNRRTKAGKKYSDLYRTKNTLGGQMRKEIARVRPKGGAATGGGQGSATGAVQKTAKTTAKKKKKKTAKKTTAKKTTAKKASKKTAAKTAAKKTAAKATPTKATPAAKKSAAQTPVKQTPATKVPVKTSPPNVTGKVGSPASTTAAPKGQVGGVKATPDPTTPKGRLGGLKGAGGTAASLALDIASIALMSYVYSKIAANEQAKFDEIEPEVQARVAALAEQARALQSKLDGKSMWVTITLTPVYFTVEDSKPYEGGEFTSLSEVLVDSVKLGAEYRSKYTEGERKVTASDGWYVKMYERRDTIETSFLFPYDPSAMELHQIARRVEENDRDSKNYRQLPPNVRQGLADERKLLDARASELLQGSPALPAQEEPKRSPEAGQESLFEIGTRTLDRARRLRATGTTTEATEGAMLGELWAAVGAIEVRESNGFANDEEKEALLTVKRALRKEIRRYMEVKAGRGDFLR